MKTSFKITLQYLNLKVRGGWGKAGNVSGIPAYAYYSLERLNKEWGSMVLLTRTGSDVSWETTTDTNFGLDFGFINNRIRVNCRFLQQKNR